MSRSFFSASPEFVCQNCQKCQTTRGAKKSVKSVNFALSGEGVPVPCPVSATGSPEFVCQNCQKCQATRGAKKSVKSVNFAPSSSMFCVGYRQPGICLSKLSKVSNDPGGEKERQKRFCSLWGGCSSSMFCVGYRPRFETWVRIRHFAGLSILQCAGRSSSNLWCSKMLAKSLQTALRGPPASNFAGLRLANQHLQASEAFWQLAALPSRF